jgi:hypothetical protein
MLLLLETQLSSLRDSSVRIVIRLQAGLCLTILQEKRFLSSPLHPARLWDPHSLLPKGYPDSLPMGKKGKANLA